MRRIQPIAVLLCATLAACVGKPRGEGPDRPDLTLKPGKAVVVVGIGRPGREQPGPQRLDGESFSLEFARIRNGRAEDLVALPDRVRGDSPSAPVTYRVLQLDPGTYALARIVASTELPEAALTPPSARNVARSPFVVHDLLGESAYQFKVAEGEVAYVGDYTVDPSYKPSRITVSHTPELALATLRKYPKLTADMVDRTPLAPTPTGLPPRSMRDTNDPLKRMPLPAGCPPVCQ